MKQKLMSVREYSKKIGITRDAVYKQIKNNILSKDVKIVKISGLIFISVPQKRK